MALNNLKSDAGSVAPIAEFWSQLTEGRAQIVTCSTSRSQLVLLARILSTRARPPEPRAALVLDRLLRGDSHKECASELDLSLSSVTCLAKQGLMCMGLGCVPSRVPLVLFMIARAGQERSSAACLRVSRFARGGAHYVCVTAPSADRLLSTLLQGAQHAVAALVADGKSYREIACQRGTSVRTVTNQVTAVFKRLEVSGRSQLLAWVARSQSVLAPLERDGRSRSPLAQK